MKYTISLICSLTNTLPYYITLVLYTELKEVSLEEKVDVTRIRSIKILNGMRPVLHAHQGT